MRIYILLFVISTLFLQGCQRAQIGENTNRPAIDTAETDPPFANKEPENYQAEIWRTSATGTEKFFSVREGQKWRVDSAYGDVDQITNLHTDKDYVISRASKVYAEYPFVHGFDESGGMIGEITEGMINGTGKAVYEKIGTEDGITKYKVTSDKDRSRETIISFDEKVGLPLKAEVFKTHEGQRELVLTITVSGVKTRIDGGSFALPSGFRKVSIDDMKKVLIGSH